jgi:hypothetical protein
MSAWRGATGLVNDELKINSNRFYMPQFRYYSGICGETEDSHEIPPSRNLDTGRD